MQQDFVSNNFNESLHRYLFGNDKLNHLSDIKLQIRSHPNDVEAFDLSPIGVVYSIIRVWTGREHTLHFVNLHNNAVDVRRRCKPWMVLVVENDNAVGKRFRKKRLHAGAACHSSIRKDDSVIFFVNFANEPQNKSAVSTRNPHLAYVVREIFRAHYAKPLFKPLTQFAWGFCMIVQKSVGGILWYVTVFPKFFNVSSVGNTTVGHLSSLKGVV